MAVSKKTLQEVERGVERGSKKPRRVRPPPEGGWGWMVVAGCFLATVCTRAVTRCVSLFLVEFQTHFDQDYSSTAWIVSLVDCTTMLCAPLGGFLASRFSCRATIILGGVLSLVGLIISAFASSLVYLYISMGLLTGLGFSFCYTPSIAMVGTYFSEKKALAFGISMSGSGIGTFVLAPVVQLLIQHYTWRGALLILGGIVSNLCVCGALMKPLGGADEEEPEAPPPKQSYLGSRGPDQVPAEGGLLKTKPLKPDHLQEKPWFFSTSRGHNHTEPDVNVRVLDGSKEVSTRGPTLCPRLSPEFGFLLLPDFLILAASILLMAYGCSAPMVYLVPYALSVGVEPQQAAFLMSIFGVSVIVGNLTFGWITDRKCLKKYRLLSYMLAVGCDGLCCMFVPLLHSFPLLVPFVIFYGYFEGAYVALIPVVGSDVIGSTYLSSSLGVVYFLHAVPFLISPPIGGWLVDRTGQYSSTFLVSGSCFLCSSLVLSIVLLRRYRRSEG